MPKRLIVYHKSYGCESGCCGHAIMLEDDNGNLDDDNNVAHYTFDHPYQEDARLFAEKFITAAMGKEHVADLDWENSFVTTD